MALVWEYTEHGNRYEVRNAGTSVRLYTNGVFHSQYSPRHLFTGAVWDLLTLPILFKDEHVDRILMLGVGGGSGIHQLNRLLSPNEIVGVELLDVHLVIAKRFFNVDYPNVRLHHDDAELWLRCYDDRFDVVIDDVFVDGVDDPYRPVDNNDAWYRALSDHLTENGVLIQNHIYPAAARKQVEINERLLKSEFSSAVLFTVPNFENCIAAFYKQPVNARTGRSSALRRIERIAKRSDMRKLRFRSSQLF